MHRSNEECGPDEICPYCKKPRKEKQPKLQYTFNWFIFLVGGSLWLIAFNAYVRFVLNGP